jgi:ABC-type nickel/cobalt efflux system permease component RcnA
MSQELIALTVTAASIGFLHTLFGPDHYLPFIVMSRSQKWSMSRTSLLTFLCGLGHIGGSVILGFVGVGLGLAVRHLEIIESIRGDMAAWLLIGFGLAYFVWGLRLAYKNNPHSHGDILHQHTHSHDHPHTHNHNDPTETTLESPKKSLTPWVLFIIFVLGPCEPLIPILMYPAAKGNIFGVVWVTAVFGTITIATMLSVVLISSFGISFLPLSRMERYTHALAGAAICSCGLAIKFLGL